jgi:DNA-directed RNA polymerase specialized sigma24 family protein
VQYLLTEIVDALDGENPLPAPWDAGDPLAVAKRHASDSEAARKQMLSSARARRAAILEAHRAGMSIRQIAAELGCSPAVVQNAVRMARAESDAETPEDDGRQDTSSV